MEESTHLSVKNTTVVERFGTPPPSQSKEPIIFNEIRGFRSMVRVRQWATEIQRVNGWDVMSCVPPKHTKKNLASHSMNQEIHKGLKRANNPVVSNEKHYTPTSAHNFEQPVTQTKDSTIMKFNHCMLTILGVFHLVCDRTDALIRVSLHQRKFTPFCSILWR